MKEHPQNISSQILYHSFPRRRSSKNPDEKSLATLRSILRHGLLMTPEIVEWRFMDGEKLLVIQKRTCFTSLGLDDLKRHSEAFGDISIGFARTELEKIGATPVLYVPRALGRGKNKRNIGSFLLERIVQIQAIMNTLNQEKKAFRFRESQVKTQEIINFTRYLASMFYPVEDIEDGKDRFYFAQKEWRIMANLIFGRKDLSFKLPSDAIKDILTLDQEFFSKEADYNTGRYSLIDQTKILASIDGKPVREYIKIVAVPKRLEAQTLDCLKDFDLNPEVVVM